MHDLEHGLHEYTYQEITHWQDVLLIGYRKVSAGNNLSAARLFRDTGSHRLDWPSTAHGSAHTDTGESIAPVNVPEIA